MWRDWSRWRRLEQRPNPRPAIAGGETVDARSETGTLISPPTHDHDVYWLEFGGEDDPFAALEATAAAADVTLQGPGVATASALDAERVSDLALTRASGELLGFADASVTGAKALLEAASIDRSGTVAVRARDVRSRAGVDTQRAERELGSVLVERGFEVDLDDPDHTLRALFSRGDLARDPAADADDPSPLAIAESDRVGLDDDLDDEDANCSIVGWVDAERRGSYGDRAPTDRPFFQPGSMDPRLARALANLAGARPGVTIVDPMCGTGGICLEAALVGARVVGLDAQYKMSTGASENLTALAPAAADVTVVRGDARQLPIATDAVDGLVVDVPYERQSAVAADHLDDLVVNALAEARRVATRAVVVADRSWVGAARDAGWTVECVHRRRVHRSLVRSIHVLSRPESTAVDADRPVDV